LNKSRGDLAYTLIDIDGAVPEQTIARLSGIAGVLNVRKV
jgi:D-3-phosphoglycerate dehydrogenase